MLNAALDALNGGLDTLNASKESSSNLDADTASSLRASGSASNAAFGDVLQNQLQTGGGILFLDRFARLTGETDDSPRVARALSSCATFGARILQTGAATYSLASSVSITINNLTIRGAGKTATTFNVTGNFVGFAVTGNYVSIEDMTVSASTVVRTVYAVTFTNCNLGAIRRCYFLGDANTRRQGVYFTGGSMGAVEDSTFDNACIRLETWDVKVSRVYIWAMNCDFGVGIFNGAGNTTLQNVDVVPPLRSNANGICGIFVDGASGKSFNTKMSNIYLDGNPALSVREGIIVGDGSAATIISHVNANRMDSDCIVIDSAYNVLISEYSGYSNNNQGLGSREIVVRQTGVQAVEKVRIIGVQCLQTAAVTGTVAPAIQVESPVGAGQVDIQGFDIKQPGAGGGYTTPEVSVPVLGGYPTMSLSGHSQLGLYRVVGSVAVASGSSSVSITLSSPYPMAYRPTPAQITLVAEGAPMPSYWVSYTSDNVIVVTFAAATTAAMTIDWVAHLIR